MPGYFVQKVSSVPGISYLPVKYISGNLPENNIDDSSLTAFNSQSLSWHNYIHNKTSIEKDKNSLQVRIENKQLHDNAILSEVHHNKAVVPLEKAGNSIGKVKPDGSSVPTIGKETAAGNIPGPIENNEYENLILAFLAGASSILLLSAIRSGIKKYKGDLKGLSAEVTKANEAEKNKKEIADMADRLDRCADRFANAKNERVELAARKVSIAINQCNDISRAKKLEKAFNDTYLSPSQASAMQHLKLDNLLSNDIGYGGGTTTTLKPDVVTTTGGFYSNSAGSLSWTMGEPISETVSDTSNTLTQGFQQGAYSVVSVVDEIAPPTINISVYPNPVTSFLNIKSDSGDPFRAEVIDLQGNIVYEQAVENGQGQIDINNLPDAMYLLGVYDKNGNRIKVFKIQKVD
ncbi:MAG TPA: T9SS type A sorting domain-containing protein [Bacteroidia bacterium]|nr:T9SS type A sorting domain-containing protein [Bacteroidia bacterium]